jgi:hypothetical protein
MDHLYFFKELVMKKGTILTGIISILLLFALLIGGCDLGGGGGGGGDDDITGTWTGEVDGYPVTVTITGSPDNTWTLSSSMGYSEAGTYTWSGSTATLLDDDGYTIGTASLSGGKLIVTISDDSGGSPEIYTLSKSGSSSGNGDNHPNITGNWTGTVGGYTVTVTITGSPANTWVFYSPAAGFENGTYTWSGSTATLQAGGYTIGTASLSGSNLIVTLNNNSDYPGTYTLSKSGSSSGNGDNHPNITGNWIGWIDGYTGPVTVTITGSPANTWGFYGSMGGSETGIYTWNGSTAILQAGGYPIGTASLSGDNLIVTLNEGTAFPGTHTLRR